MKRQYRELMIVLFVSAALALNYPLLSLVDRLLLPLGIPLLYLYLFIVWLAVIALMALLAERSEAHHDDRPGT